ncbi:MAG TPA: hypothetical protein VFD10_08865 [Atribacterota bacterium]|nr:hypothetical protein [Atribacterota bacterium]
MSKSFFKKIFVSLVLIAVLGVISAGCGTTAPPITPPPGPTTYTVTVMSQDPLCYGTVYVNGLPTSSYLLTWGSTQVYNVASGAAIYLVDPGGFQSHTEIFNPLFGTTVVFNSWW